MSLLRLEQQKQTCPSSPIRTILLLSLQCLITFSYAASHDPAKSLLKLRQSFTNSSALSTWEQSTRPCIGGKSIWAGVICSKGGSVYGLRLENIGLSGKIDVDALLQLPKLRTISLSGNNFGGPFPEIKGMRSVKSIYFSNNSFEGTIDRGAFDGLNRLKKVHMANNKLTGEIPSSLTKLPKLVELRLEGNQFDGPIPEFGATSFNDLNLANNQLEGPIPVSLSHMNPEAFAANKGLCGMPLNACPPPANHNQQNEPTQLLHQKKSVSIIPIIIAAAVVLFVALLVIAMILRKRNPKSQGPHRTVQPSALPARKPGGKHVENVDEGSHRSTGSTRSGKGDSGRLCFVREAERFDLPDLLKASAEILGSGCFGSSYKANLMSGSMMVVKRFKQMNNVGREEFREHMRRLGRLEHKNLLPLVAYYYRKEEKLLVSNFVQKGSLAVHLHGNHSRGQPTLDWPARLKIIKGVARGLQYLYKELPCLIAPHCHLKSSNVLLDESFNPLLNDYGLVPLINQESAQELLVAYKSPEYVNNGRINKKTDVWSLGILIIETLSGEFPANYLQQGSEVDLTSWVKGVVGEGKGIEVFDGNMTATRNSEGEMQKLLKIGLACCESNVDKRWDIKDACDRIEEVKERDNDDDFYSSYASEGEKRSSRGLSDEFTVIVN